MKAKLFGYLALTGIISLLVLLLILAIQGVWIQCLNRTNNNPNVGSHNRI
jgi:hypothetical protein